MAVAIFSAGSVNRGFVRTCSCELLGLMCAGQAAMCGLAFSEVSNTCFAFTRGLTKCNYHPPRPFHQIHSQFVSELICG